MSEPSFRDDVLGELGDDKLTEIAGLLGTDTDGARDTVAQTVGALTGDLQQKADDDDEVRQAIAEVAEPPLQGVATLGGGLGGMLGGGMMAGVLAKVSKPVANALSKKTGIPAATISRVIEMLIPVLLAVFAKRAAAGEGHGRPGPDARRRTRRGPRRGRRWRRRPAGPDPGRRQEVTRSGVLGHRVGPMAESVRLRDPEPGDLGWIVQRHGALYAAEYGWNSDFEGLVARIVADFAQDHDPTWNGCGSRSWTAARSAR